MKDKQLRTEVYYLRQHVQLLKEKLDRIDTSVWERFAALDKHLGLELKQIAPGCKYETKA